MKSRIKNLLFRDEELNKLILLVMHSFFSAIFVSIFFSIANAEFVNNFGSDFLPVGYLLSGIVGYITVQGYSYLLKKSGYGAFVGGLFFLLVATIFFRCSLYFTDADGTKWLSFIIFLFAMPFLTISGLEQSGLLLKMYNIREGKKYAGIISSGGTLSSIIGYLSIPLLVPFFKSRYDLFFIAIGGISIALYLLFRINKKLKLDEQKVEEKKSEIKSDISLKRLLRQKYIFYIAICGGFSTMAFYFVDYSFLINAKSQASSPENLTAILGGFFAFIKSAEFVLSILSGRIFRNFGLKFGMIVLPAICVFITLFAILIYNFSDGAAFIFIIFSLKLFDRIVSKAIEEPTFKNLYQIMNARDMLSIQAKIEGSTKQLFIILVSSILLLYSHFMPSASFKIGLLYISLPFFILWLFSARQLIKSFKEKLKDILNPENSGEYISPFERLRAFFNNYQQDASDNFLINLLNYNTNLFCPQKKVFDTLAPYKTYESYIPAPYFKYLISSPGHSRLEYQIYKPILVIPPIGIISKVSETKSFEFLDEKEILKIALFTEQPDENILRALDKKFDDLKHDHEKKIILNILERSNLPLSTEILLKRLVSPDYYTRKKIFNILENKNFKFVQMDEVIYRTSLEGSLSDMTYVISALAGISNTDKFLDLKSALLVEENIIKNRILSILTWKYDKASIKVIRENIFFKNSDKVDSNNILALELIDNLIESEIKSRVMAVFESGSYIRRLSVLNKWYNHEKLDLKQTLITILYYDYTKIGIWTKACVLKILLQNKNQEYKHIMSGLSYHTNVLLSSLANEYIEMVDDNLIYPLSTKEEFFNKNSKTKHSAIKGTDIYSCIKALKSNVFFTNTSLNDLVRFSFSFEFKKCNSLQELNFINSHNNKPYFILNGNIIYEFKNNFSPELFRENFILPSMYNESGLSNVLIHSQTTLYEFSLDYLTNLILTSDSLMNDILKGNK
jgi:hypothetical protein